MLFLCKGTQSLWNICLINFPYHFKRPYHHPFPTHFCDSFLNFLYFVCGKFLRGENLCEIYARSDQLSHQVTVSVVTRPDLKPKPVSCISTIKGCDSVGRPTLWCGDEIREKNSYKLQHLNVQTTKIVLDMNWHLLECKNVAEYQWLHIGWKNLLVITWYGGLQKALLLQMYKCKNVPTKFSFLVLRGLQL